MSESNNKLTVKDLITTGVFSAIIFFAISFGGGFFAMIPAVTFYFPVGASLFAGPVFLLMVAKVPKTGPITIVSILMALFCFLTGMHYTMAVGYLVCGILAEILAYTRRYKSIRMNIISYMVFCFGGTATYITYYVNPQGWIKFMLNKGTEQQYIDIMTDSATTFVLVTMLIGTVVIGWLSGFVGSKLLKKHFEKAGITA